MLQAPGKGMQRGYYVYSRRALLLAPMYDHRESQQVVAAAGQEAPAAGDISSGGAPTAPGSGSSFDANVVMILAVLLCALICALGLNSIVRCALRCSGSSRAAALSSSPDGDQERQRQRQAGMRRKALRAMPTLVYSASAGAGAGAGSPSCAICLADFEPGERVRVLPKCNHGFHVCCVDRWLLARSTCPTCRQPLFGAPRKASACADGAGAAPARSSFLVPLRPEGFVTSYDF